MLRYHNPKVAGASLASAANKIRALRRHTDARSRRCDPNAGPASVACRASCRIGHRRLREMAQSRFRRGIGREFFGLAETFAQQLILVPDPGLERHLRVRDLRVLVAGRRSARALQNLRELHAWVTLFCRFCAGGFAGS